MTLGVVSPQQRSRINSIKSSRATLVFSETLSLPLISRPACTNSLPPRPQSEPGTRCCVTLVSPKRLQSRDLPGDIDDLPNVAALPLTVVQLIALYLKHLDQNGITTNYKIVFNHSDSMVYRVSAQASSLQLPLRFQRLRRSWPEILGSVTD